MHSFLIGCAGHSLAVEGQERTWLAFAWDILLSFGAQALQHGITSSFVLGKLV